MALKTLLCPQRVRQIPKRFSWVDQRLVRERHIEHCTHAGAALYLFLLTVGDARGLSYYADKSIMQHLRMPSKALGQARQTLLHLDLIAWQEPVYQVLSLDGVSASPATVQACPVQVHPMAKVGVNKLDSSSVLNNTQAPCKAAQLGRPADPKLAKQVLAQLRKRLS